MKKLLLILISLLMITTFLYAQEGSTEILFHGFPWGTSIQEFKARMGEPAHVEEVNGLQSFVYQDIRVFGFSAFMVVFFSANGLEGGTYYFDTAGIEELMRAYADIQAELLAMYGPTLLYEELRREMRTYETSWNLPSGYVYLKINTRWWNEPVTLWLSSPALTRKLRS